MDIERIDGVGVVVRDHDIQEGLASFEEKRPPQFRGIVATPRWDSY